MAKTEMVFARVEPKLKALTTKAAQIDDRTESYVVRRALIEYLKIRGMLPANYSHTPEDEADMDDRND